MDLKWKRRWNTDASNQGTDCHGTPPTLENAEISFPCAEDTTNKSEPCAGGRGSDLFFSMMLNDFCDSIERLLRINLLNCIIQ